MMKLPKNNRIDVTVLTIIVMSAIHLHASPAYAQAYPNKPVRLLSNPPGGAPDYVARLVLPALSAALGQQVIVDNRPAAAAIETAAKAAPDGYTILITGSALWLLPFLRDQVPWHPTKDFEPITAAITSPLILVVHPAVPVKSVKELIDVAKAKPGELNYGSTSTGTLPHVAAELFRAMTGVNIVRVTYKSAGPALIAIASGEVQTAFATPSSAIPHMTAGRVRALAVTSKDPSALAPGLPTVAASVPGYEAASIVGFFAPAKTPPAIIERLHQHLATILKSPDVKEKVLKTSAETVGDSPAQFAATLRSEMARLGKVIKASQIREQ
jgi:tripartite-type tricarboxylate transporter receptor subunit TctC